MFGCRYLTAIKVNGGCGCCELLEMLISIEYTVMLVIAANNDHIHTFYTIYRAEETRWEFSYCGTEAAKVLNTQKILQVCMYEWKAILGWVSTFSYKFYKKVYSSTRKFDFLSLLVTLLCLFFDSAEYLFLIK